MNSFLNFTRAEWSALIFIMLLLLGSIIFPRLSLLTKKPNIDFASFEGEIDRFIETQKILSDSLEMEKKKREAYYGTDRKFYNAEIKEDTSGKAFRNPKDQYRIVKVNINRCDSSDIVRIPLFGNKRAAKLIEYRNALGGYYELQQLQEIFILQSLNIEHLEKYFYIDTTALVPIRINHIDYRELVAHPYFDAYLTKSVLHYRQKYGVLHDLEDFKKATHVYPELLEKLRPYLSFEE